MGIEIERKWLMRQAPVLPARPLYFEAAIEQGYLEGNVPDLRIRRSRCVSGAAVYHLTAKRGGRVDPR